MTKESLYDGHNDDDAEPLRDDYDHEAEPLRFAYDAHNGHDVKPSRRRRFDDDAEADPLVYFNGLVAVRGKQPAIKVSTRTSFGLISNRLIFCYIPIGLRC